MSYVDEMRVTKRNKGLEEISFDKILKRIKSIGREQDLHNINYSALCLKIIDQLYDKIETTKIDELTGEQCASQTTKHPDFGKLASAIVISNLHKNTKSNFLSVMRQLYQNNFISKSIINVIEKHKDIINNTLDYSRDNLIDYFGFKTLEKSYLMRINKVIVERPQHMWMRVSIGIHGDNIERIKETYDYMSKLYFTHATPTLFNAGTPRPQLSSCFLLSLEEDSISGIYNTLKDCAMISKWAGGIGIHVHNLRATGSHIRGTNGISNGIVPMLRVFNMTARYVDQCITPNTYIYTTKGPLLIENVYAGETQIYNSEGKNETIDNVLEHSYNGEIFNIHTMHSIEPLQITGEHPVYVLNNQKRGLNYSIITNRLQKKIISPEWKDVKELDNNDIMLYKIPTYEKDISRISEKDCYMYGIILGDGYMKNKSETGHITLHVVNKRHVLEFCEEYFINKCVNYKIDINENIARIRWNKNNVLPFRYKDIYDEQGEKHIYHSWLNLPINKIKYIVKGLLVTDGCIQKEIIFDSTSRNLIESMKYLLLRMKILSSGYIRNRIGKSHNTNKGLITHKKINYCLRVPKTAEICKLVNITKENKSYEKFFLYENLLGTRIQKIEKTNYSGTLYDLQMKEVHDYMIHHGIIHNGGGKRNGSFAIYIEPWHGDIESFLDLRKNHGDEELRARDLFYALWIPDLFMKKVKNNEDWCLFCPNICPGLSEAYGDAFNELYSKYENEEKYMKKVKARDLWFKVLDSQMETGTPYLLYKDACNEKSNQKNLGTIKSSNLCTEIIEYSDEKESAVCNLASIALSKFVKEDKTFDYDKLHELSKIVTYNLNKVIDVNYYPTEKTERSNMRHRPIGIGVQGLADTFMLMDISFTCDKAKETNKFIFETIYHGALEMSNEIAKERYELFKNNEYKTANEMIKSKHFHKYEAENINKINERHIGAYSTFTGSPASTGILQFDMWNMEPSNRYDWNTLKKNIIDYGIRNSLLLAPMPTASTSQILGNNECFEPFTSNIYTRRTIAGEFVMVNKYLMNELIELDIWNDDVKASIIENKGSIQHIEGLSDHIKEKYKIVWEMSMKELINMAADRGAFICQSQSLNLWLEDPTYNTLTSMHFYSWEKGLKTGIYYLRRKPKHQPQQFTIVPKEQQQQKEEEECEMCGS